MTTDELIPGREYKLKGIRQYVKVIRNLVREETGEAYVEVWDSNYAGYWSGQRLVPVSEIMTDRSRATR